MQGLNSLDWTVSGIYFALIPALAGWVMPRNQNSMEDYFLAGHNMGWFKVGATIFASFSLLVIGIVGYVMVSFTG
jgi:Na+/proline symporter